MAPKRRDNKGRILQIGEWQEPSGRYRFMYNDARVEFTRLKEAKNELKKKKII